MCWNGVALAGNAVLRIDVDQIRRVFGQLDFVVNGEGGNDQNVAGRSATRGRAVDRDNARSAFCANRVGCKAFSIVYVPDINLFVFTDIGSIEQILVNRA